MRKFLVLILSCVSFSLFAQVGRYEEPVDTIPIGGQTQEIKETQMKTQDQLTKELISVRDSLQYLSPEANALSKKRELDEIVQGLRARDPAPELMKKGFALLNAIRSELRAGVDSVGRDSRTKSFRK